MNKHPRFISLIFYSLFFICPLLFFTDLTRNPYYTQIALLNILICLAWLLWLLQAWKQKEWAWVRTPLDPLLWALMAVCLVSLISAFYQHPFFWKPIYSEGSRAYIFLIVNVYLVFAAALRYQDRDRFKRLLWLTYAVCLIASVYGVAQYFGTEWIWPHNLNPYGSRPVSTFGNPNFMSSFLVMILPVAIADYSFKATGMPRVLLFVVVITTVSALLATLTRSSWAGAAAAVFLLTAGLSRSPEVWNKIRKPVTILGVTLFLLVVAWPKSSTAAYSETVLGRISEVKQAMHGTYAALSQRLLIWTCAWEMVEDHPVLGQGWGCFELFYPFYQGTQLTREVNFFYRTHANNAHDEILEYWSQVGTVGLGIVILMWVVFFRMAVSITGRLPVPWNALQWGLIGGVAGMLVDNLLNVSVHFAVPAFLFWWWVGSALMLDSAAQEVRRIDLQAVWRRALVGGAVVVLIGFMARSACLWAEEVYFFEGFKLSKSGTDLTAARLNLEKAYAFHHLEVNNNYELANVYARLGQKDRALFMYQRSMDANAGYDEIYFNRATMYLQTGQEAEAIRNYKIVLDINPLSREAYNALAGIYLRDIPKYGDAAATLYHQAVSVYPQDKDFWNNLGFLETQRMHWEEAYQAYHHAIEVDPDFELARRNLQIVAQKTTGHAQDPYLKIDSLMSQVEELISAKNLNAALPRAKELVAFVPNSSRAHFDYGNILFGLNELEEAAHEYEQSVQLKPDAAAIWQNLAVTYDRLKRTNDALDAWQHLLQLDKNNAQAKARLHLP